MATKPQYLNSEQACEYLGITRTKLNNLVNSGKLVVDRLERRLFFDPAVLKRFKANYVPRTQWTLEKAYAESQKYTSAKDFWQFSGGAYLYLKNKHSDALKQILMRWRDVRN